jgi:hypothetical protein
LVPGIFVLALFFTIETSYRVYTVGEVALNPFRANSLTTLMRSKFVQLSEFPDVYFELKPDMDGWFRGVRLKTNSAGLADNEYARDKPDDAFRVAVVGSSWTMASGVATDQSWHAVLERQLNGPDARQNIEILNFGVELYGLRELVGTVRHRVAEWHPDLIVVAITSFTTSFLWEEADNNQVLPNRAYPFFESYAYRALAGALGWSVDQPADDRPRIGSSEVELRISQLQRALRELDKLSVAQDVPVVIVMLGFVPLSAEIERAITAQAEQLGMTVIFANRIFPFAEKERSKLQLNSFDRHPNEAGHELIAGFVGAALQQEKFLRTSGLVNVSPVDVEPESINGGE